MLLRLEEVDPRSVVGHEGSLREQVALMASDGAGAYFCLFGVGIVSILASECWAVMLMSFSFSGVSGSSS